MRLRLIRVAEIARKITGASLQERSFDLCPLTQL